MPREHAPAGSGDALHKAGGEVLFSRNCKNLTDRFTSIRDAVPSLPAPSAVIDGELVACDTDGMPDFFALMRRRTDGLCVWGFDLLELNGRDLRTRPLATRKDKLRDILIVAATTRCVSRRASRVRRGIKPSPTRWIIFGDGMVKIPS